MLVVGVEPDSLARRAGLEEGDVVIEADGRPIRSIDDLQRLLPDERVGKTFPVTLLRGTEKLHTDVTAGEVESEK